MNLVLFGAPGSGKGTQSLLLGNYLGLGKISLGDILREEVKKNSDIGKEVESYMLQGVLVPDALVTKVIEANLGNKGFILDGYPRNLSQAETLESILAKKSQRVDVFIYLDLDEQTIIDRLIKRKRKDDTLEVIKKRWQVFSKESQKILDFYEKNEKLIRVEGRGSKDEIFTRIKNKLPCKIA